MFNYLVDYHVHTDNSFDSETTMYEQCQRAVEIGLKEIVFTEHFDLNPFDEGLDHCDYKIYSQQIEECRDIFGDKLIIKKGLELGEPHIYYLKHEEYLKDKEFDFFLGSVHYLGNDLLGASCVGKNEREVYEEYFSEVLEIAKKGEFHVLAHLDVLKRYVPKHFKKFYSQDYEEMIREILREAIRNDKGLEINTSGFRQTLGEPLPTIEVLQWYKELGGHIITIGSDAHNDKDLGQGLREGMKIAKDLGFEAISVYSKGQRGEIKL